MKEKNFKITIEEYGEKLSIELTKPDPILWDVYEAFLKLLKASFSEKAVYDMLSKYQINITNCNLQIAYYRLKHIKHEHIHYKKSLSLD